MVLLLVELDRATHEGNCNWAFHFTCVQDMCPYMFSYDRVNYARQLPVLYWCTMINLPNTQEEVDEELRNGAFSVQRSVHSFSQETMDKTTEEAMTSYTKTKGGIINFSTNKSVTQRWTLIYFT